MSTPNVRRKAGEIEFFRFLFSLIILLRHAEYCLDSIKNTPFGGGALAVEFFFIVSGYLLAASALKRGQTPPVEIGRETVGFIGKKLSGFYPEFLIAWCIAFAVTVAAKGYSLKETVFFGASCIWEVLLLLNTGLRVGTVNSVVWYLSAMLLCMAILYPLLRKYPDVMRHIVAPLVCVLIFGYLLRTYKNLRTPALWIGFTYKSTVRAMAELCLGIVVYNVVQAYRGLKLNALGQALLSAVKWFCYAGFIWYLRNTQCDERDFVFTLMVAVAVGISFSGMSLDARLFDNRVCLFLGKFSLPLYLSHFFYAKTLNSFLPDGFTNGEKLLIYVALSVVTAAFVMFAALLWRKNQARVSIGLRKMLLAEEETSMN